MENGAAKMVFGCCQWPNDLDQCPLTVLALSSIVLLLKIVQISTKNTHMYYVEKKFFIPTYTAYLATTLH